MPTRGLIPVRTTLTGGLNLQPNYSTFEECSDCRNVWAPNGELVLRPGYTGLFTLFPYNETCQTPLQYYYQSTMHIQLNDLIISTF